MQFYKDSNVYKAVKITGPSHNLLGLIFFEDESQQEVEVITLPVANTPRIDKNEVRSQVLSGVNEINDKLMSKYQVRQIQFVPSDTPSAEVYKLLTKEIITRIHNREGFITRKLKR